MRILALVAALAWCAVPAVAELRPDGTTMRLGLGLAQNGVPVVLEQQGKAYVATLAPGPFVLTFPDQTPEIVGVTFGPEGLFDLLDLPPEAGLFGPASGYARLDGPEAAHYMADPLCASPHFGPGFNLLDPTRRTAEGYPVTTLEVDAASCTCTAEGRLPSETDLLGRISPLYVVVRTDAGTQRLILHVGGS
ncbi:hypothetical protein A8B78_06595 [Jannaschia sp. EhC01]|nr:hypothetical protein A8B78_06595 [Jannaschia sp. EhC01]